jgi:predicted O-linked N-acetylglucosamine transferase (SPINDLY family)
MVASVLHSLDLDELIAEDTESYCRIVSDLCTNQGQLTRYRVGLRTQFEKSSVREEVGFTKSLESKFRQVLNF